MEKITYSDYMNNEFEFKSVNDEKTVLEYWSNDYELFTDITGRVYTESNLYIADIKINKGSC